MIAINPGLPTADGEIVAAGLGKKHAIFLAHRGMLNAGRSVAEALFLANFMERMERMARLQVDAAAVGGVKPIDVGEAARARDFLWSERIMNLTLVAWGRGVERGRRA